MTVPAVWSASGTSLRGRAGRAVTALWLALGALVFSGTPAAGQPQDPGAAELGLTVEAGFDGRVVPSRWLPVTVRLDPARAVRGVLVVESRSVSGVVREQQTVEVAARTPSLFRLAVPAGHITVSVQEPGRDRVAVSPSERSDTRSYLVGVLGGVPDAAPPLRHDPTGMSGVWVGVDPEWLSRSGQALDPLDALVAHSPDLAALPPDARATLAAAVGAGMDLVVVLASQGTGVDLELPPLPAHPGGAGHVVDPEAGTWVIDGQGGAAAAAHEFGRGRVVAIGEALGPGSGELWNRVVEPGSRAVPRSEWAPDRNPRTFAGLFRSEDAAPPALPWLAGFAAVYVLVVGPVNGLLLARLGRRELAWVTVPAITVVFTAGAFVGVSGSRPPVGDSARVLVSIEGAATEVVAASVRGPTEGARSVEVRGAGWTARTLTEGGGRATVHHGADGVSAVLELRALQHGGLLATRPVAAASPLRLSAVQDAHGMIIAELSNDGSDTIEDIIVMAATARAHAGSLRPGASTVVEIGGGSLPLVPPWADPLRDMARLPGNLLGLLGDALIDRNPGLVWAAGSLPGGGGDREVVIEGQPAQDRGLLAATAVTPSLAAPAGPFAVQRASVVPSSALFPSPLAVDGGAGEVYLRLRLPAGSEVPVVVADVDAGEGRPTLEVWMPGEREWRPIAAVFEGGRASPEEVLGALGSVWLRVTDASFPIDFSGRTVHALERGGGGP